MRISDWSSDVCSSDLLVHREAEPGREDRPQRRGHEGAGGLHALVEPGQRAGARHALTPARSEAQRADRGRGGRTMVERAAELRPEDLDELVDRRLVRLWLYWGMLWLMLTPTVGVTISALFNFPDYLGTSLELTFGRLRPIHVNGVIFGAFSTLFLGLSYYLVPRLCGVRVVWPKIGAVVCWIWNINIAFQIGRASCRERVCPYV